MRLLRYSKILFSCSSPLCFVNHFNPSILFVGKALAENKLVERLFSAKSFPHNDLTHPSPNDWIQSFDDHFYFILFLKRTYFYKFFLVFLFALWHLLPEILNKQLFNSHVAKCNEFFYVAIISTFFDIAQYPHILRNLQVIPLSPTWGRTMPEFD